MNWLQDLLCGADEEPEPENPKVTRKVERVSAVSTDNLGNDFQNQSEPIVGFHVSGQCPSCAHATTDLFALASVSAGGSGLGGVLVKAGVRALGPGGIYLNEVVVGSSFEVVAWQRASDHAGPVQVGLVRCRCSGVHPEADGKVGTALGCGSMWLLSACLDVDNPTAGATLETVPEDEQDKYWAGAEAVSSGAEGASKSVRDVAGKWQTALTGVLALAAVGTALSRDTILKLSPWTQCVVGMSGLVAILANGMALFHASVASSGFPRVRNKTEPRDIVDWDLAPLRYAKASAEALVTAVVCAIVAVLAAIIAIGFLAFTPAAKGPTEVRLTLNDELNTSTCGTVTPTSTGVHFKPSAAGQSEHDYPLGSIKSIGPC